MEIRNPNYLVEIARQKGISRAAEQLFVTQSTLSQYLLKLRRKWARRSFSGIRGG